MKVLELRGYRSLKVLNAFHSLMLGLKMLPAYQHESYETFFTRVQSMPASDQEKMLREASLFVNLEKDEVEAMLGFTTDANGVPISPENIKSLKPDEMFERIVAVCVEFSKIKIDFVSSSEKKN